MLPYHSHIYTMRFNTPKRKLHPNKFFILLPLCSYPEMSRIFTYYHIPSQYTLSIYPPYIPSQYTLSIYPLYIPSQYTTIYISHHIYPLNIPLSIYHIYPLNIPLSIYHITYTLSIYHYLYTTILYHIYPLHIPSQYTISHIPSTYTIYIYHYTYTTTHSFSFI